MAVVIMQSLTDTTAEMYDAVAGKLGVDADPPEGMIVHTAFAAEGGMRIVDVWESVDHFERFRAERLLPAYQEVTGDMNEAPDPSRELHEVHHLAKGG